MIGAYRTIPLLISGILFLASCSTEAVATQPSTEVVESLPDPTKTVQQVLDATPTEAAISTSTATTGSPTSTMPAPEASIARVVDVKVNGEPGNYSFVVTVSSPDEGCTQYADWWEVISPGGELIYRRVLLHSHVAEQPFTRSGGPAVIEAGDEVIVRVHMNTSGYSGLAMSGSVEGGFETVELEPGFAAGLSEIQPLPGDCDF